MSTPRYFALIENLCALAKIPSALAHASTVDFVVDDVCFTLIEAGHNDEKALNLFCDFGPLPAKQRERILAQLMHMNLAMVGVNTPSFAMNPETGHVLLTRRIVIDALTADELLQALCEHAQHAMAWRQHHFLQIPKTSSSTQADKLRSSHQTK